MTESISLPVLQSVFSPHISLIIILPLYLSIHRPRALSTSSSHIVILSLSTNLSISTPFVLICSHFSYLPHILFYLFITPFLPRTFIWFCSYHSFIYISYFKLDHLINGTAMEIALGAVELMHTTVSTKDKQVIIV